MAKYESLATYLSLILGNNFDIKYFKNQSPDWESIISSEMADEMIHGSLKVNGGQNLSIKDFKTTIVEFAFTLMIPQEMYSNVIDSIEDALKEIDKKLILLGEEYSQYNMEYHSDEGEYIYHGNKYNAVTFYNNLVDYDSVLIGDSQTIEIEIDNEYVFMLGTIGINFTSGSQFDSSTASNAIQKTYLAGYSESIVVDGLAIKNDAARAYLAANRRNKPICNLRFFDGEITYEMLGQLQSYTSVGVSGGLVKYQYKFILKG